VNTHEAVSNNPQRLCLEEVDWKGSAGSTGEGKGGDMGKGFTFTLTKRGRAVSETQQLFHLKYGGKSREITVEKEGGGGR